MAWKKRRFARSSSRRTTSRSSWRRGRWSGDGFGDPCFVGPSCDVQLLSGAPFSWPSTGPCDTQLFFPILFVSDFSPHALVDYQDRVTYRGSEIHYTISVDPRWVLDAQTLGVGNAILQIPWRQAVFWFDADEPANITLSSLFNEDWLTYERIIQSTGGLFQILGGATVDGVQTRNFKIRKPARLTNASGIYILWEMGCPYVQCTAGQSYEAAWATLQPGPLQVQGWHRTFYVT